MRLSPHFSFNGNCREAVKFYAETFGGRIVRLVTYGETPMSSQVPPALKEQIAHARIEIDGQYLMGADAPPDRYKAAQGTMVSIGVDTPAEADRVFGALAKDGLVTMPIGETFFAHRFGMCTDRFGVQWMVIAEKTM